MPTEVSVDLVDIVAARGVIRGLADATPLVRSHCMSRIAGQDFLLKLETTQLVGAFKLRGATHAVAALPDTVAGVTCCSTGNHGRALAFAAARRGIRAVICMSHLVPAVKVEAVRALGAQVRIVGTSQDEAAVESRRLCLEDGLVEIPPFDNAHVIAGQGTIGLELLEARPDLSTILIPLSGGGLAAGIAVAAKAINSKIKLVGVSMDRGAAMHASIHAGHPVDLPEYASLADSLGGGIGLDNRLSYTLCRSLLDDLVLVSEEDIRNAMQLLYFEDNIVAEGAAAVGLAAVLSRKVKLRGPTATIISGRNVDMTVFRAIMAGEDVTLGNITVKGRRYGT
jgi:threonine dehydratase